MILEKTSNGLVQLVNSAQQLLANSTIRPEELEEHASQLELSIQSAREMPLITDAKDLEKLEQILNLARNTKNSVENKLDLWKKFCELRDEINEKQDVVQAQFDALKNKGLRCVEDFENEKVEIEVSV